MLTNRFRHVLRSTSPLSIFAALLLASPARAQLDYYSEIDGAQEPTNSPHTGTADILIDTVNDTLSYTINFTGLGSPETAAHIHGPAVPFQAAPPAHTLPPGNPKVGVWNYLPAEEADILAGLYYINIHSMNFPNGEIRGQICPRPQGYCFCDTASGPPCGNDDATAGCRNSTGQGALMTFSGLPSIILDTLELQAISVPANQNGIFFMADNQNQLPFGDGQLCATGGVRRILPPVNSGPTGTLTLAAGFVSAQGLVAGQIKTFQAWFRDPMGPCGSGFNTSNGLSVELTP